MVKLEMLVCLITLLGLVCSFETWFKDSVSSVPFVVKFVIFLVFSGFVYYYAKLFIRPPTVKAGKMYAKQISKEEFDIHCLCYTQYKLIELFRSKEFTLFTQKMVNKPCMPYEKINFSDEE